MLVDITPALGLSPTTGRSRTKIGEVRQNWTKPAQNWPTWSISTSSAPKVDPCEAEIEFPWDDSSFDQPAAPPSARLQIRPTQEDPHPAAKARPPVHHSEPHLHRTSLELAPRHTRTFPWHWPRGRAPTRGPPRSFTTAKRSLSVASTTTMMPSGRGGDQAAPQRCGEGRGGRGDRAARGRAVRGSVELGGAGRGTGEKTGNKCGARNRTNLVLLTPECQRACYANTLRDAGQLCQINGNN